MDLVRKFVLNTTEFQVHFDNDKKTYVALNLETGEKTNVGVLGTFLQMGILKPFEEVDKKDAVMQRLNLLEEKVDKLLKTVDVNYKTTKEIEKPSEEPLEEIQERKPKSEVTEKIIEKTLKRISKEKEEVKEESDEELNNWLDV